MAGTSTAGVEFSRDLMRYAEVEQNDGHLRLLRLGNCAFEFDAEAVLFEGQDLSLLEAIREAMADIFRDTEASSFRFVIPSRFQTRFTTAVPIEADVNLRSALIGYETRLFTKNQEGGDIFPSHLGSDTDSSAQMFAVSHIDDAVSRSVKALDSVFPEASFELAPSMMAATLAFRHVAHRRQLPGRYYLLVGSGIQNTDFILMKGAEPVTQESMEVSSPKDQAYRALLCCSRFGISWQDIERVFVYGSIEDDTLVHVMNEAFGPEVERINPGVVVGLDADHFGDSFPIEAFLPVMGAAIQ
ncbi:MAG: hypothetical protein ACPG8N_02855 [Rhodothermales bacterium]